MVQETTVSSVQPGVRYWTVPPTWQGQTVCILAGGLSVKAQQAQIHNAVHSCHTIVINDSYRICRYSPDILYFRDLSWWQKHRAAVLEHGAPLRIITCGTPTAGVRCLRDTGYEGYESDPGGLRQGGNSGYQAINLACHYGAARIILLGFDMHAPADGPTHWFGGRTGISAGEYNRRCAKWLPVFETLAAEMPKHVEVLNASPDSALNCWPKVKLEDVL